MTFRQVQSARTTHPDIAAALAECRRSFWSVAFFSGAVNILMLAGPLYMLQVYDRVLASRSVPTLIALSVFLVGAYLFQGSLDVIRSRIVVRSAAVLDFRLSRIAHAMVLKAALAGRKAGEAVQPVRDLDQIRAFLTGTGPIAIVDLPWMPFFLALCFLIHPWLGIASLVGAIVLFALTILTERNSREPVRNLALEGALRSTMIESNRRNSESIVAMGMAGALEQRWAGLNERYLAATGRSSDVMGSYGSVSKVVRLLLQSVILGLGAYLVIQNELTAGGMIAASIMMGRALAPIETVIANWRSLVSARQSRQRLSEMLGEAKSATEATQLPKPGRSLDVEQLTVVAPGTETPILREVRFQLRAGEALGVIGPSGAGKTSLVRTLLGLWPPGRGVVRLDGAALDQWDPERLGQYVGFVSQAIDLFEGTVAENISRMAIQPDSEAVVKAARAAGAHDMILRLQQGYDTRIGDSGAILSGGQRQRIALARALYGDPFLIVLDEPQSNLDNDGEIALMQAIRDAKARGSIVLIIAHRPSALAVCEKVLFLSDGLQRAFGPRDEVLQKVLAPPPSPPANVSSLKVVSDSSGGSER